MHLLSRREPDKEKGWIFSGVDSALSTVLQGLFHSILAILCKQTYSIITLTVQKSVRLKSF
jgi:hypothetical protein